MYVIFDSLTGQISEHPSLSELVDTFSNRNLTPLYYWTLGLEDWISLDQVLTKKILENRKKELSKFYVNVRNIFKAFRDKGTNLALIYSSSYDTLMLIACDQAITFFEI